MAKWNPKMIHFHPYSINGTPFRPHHGDWFSTKGLHFSLVHNFFCCLHKTFVYHLPSGVAYVRIEVKGFNLHLFCTHVSFNQSPSLVYKLLKLFQSLDARPVRRRGGHYGPIFHPSRLSVVRAGKVHQPNGLQLLEPFLARPHRPRW